MHFSTVFCSAALIACAIASPLAAPNNYKQKCTTVYKTTKKTITKTTTSTSTVPCPVLSLPNVPILTSIGVTGTLVRRTSFWLALRVVVTNMGTQVPIGSLTSELLGNVPIPTGIINREAAAERNNYDPECTTTNKCTITKTKCGGTITKTVKTSTTATPTNCPILSLPNVPILTSIGVTGTLVPIQSITSDLNLPTQVIGGREAAAEAEPVAEIEAEE